MDTVRELEEMRLENQKLVLLSGFELFYKYTLIKMIWENLLFIMLAIAAAIWFPKIYSVGWIAVKGVCHVLWIALGAASKLLSWN